MRLILIRHGESEGNASGVIQGRMDFGLSPTGLLQARATAAHLAALEVDRVVTSPLRRAADTAETIAGPLGQSVVHMPELMEYDIGEASGLSNAELRERFPDVFGAYTTGRRPTFPGEEGRDTFNARLQAALGELGAMGGTTVAVAHGGVISSLCHIVVGLDTHRPGAFHVANCSITEVVRDRAGRLVLARHNDTCHLEGIETFADRG
jgi:broad specificity phosphatase PhoE